MALALLALVLFACGGNESKKSKMLSALAEMDSTLVDERGAADPQLIPQAIDLYCSFAEQYPDDPTAPNWLFKAFQLAKAMGNLDQAAELGNKLIEDFPNYEYAPVVMFMMARDVYDMGYHDLDKARAMYERVIDQFPDSNWAANAKEMKDKYLGMTDEEIMNQIQFSQMEVVEGEW